MASGVEAAARSAVVATQPAAGSDRREAEISVTANYWAPSFSWRRTPKASQKIAHLAVGSERHYQEALLCSLLDAGRGGALRLTPRDLVAHQRRYREGTGMLVTRLRTATGDRVIGGDGVPTLFSSHLGRARGFPGLAQRSCCPATKAVGNFYTAQQHPKPSHCFV